MNIIILGIGAIGSNLTARLVSDLKGEHKITVLDKDTVEERNITAGTQFYMPNQIGIPKVEALQFNIYQQYEKEIEIINKEIRKDNSQNIMSPFDLIVDCFDNTEARTASWLYGSNRVIHIGFSDQFTFAIEWSENYKVPSDINSGMDICTMRGASAFINMVSSLGSLVIEEFIFNKKKLNMVGNKFTHTVIV